MAQKTGNVLIIDDNEDVLLAARLLLKKHVAHVRTEQDPQNIPAVLHNETFDAILLDMNFVRDVTSGSEGFFWLEKILDIAPTAVVIMMTAFGDVDLAVRAIKAGATDFVLKPWQNEKLVATIASAMRLHQSQQEAGTLRQRRQQLSADLDQGYLDMIGTSQPMQQVFAAIEKVAATDANVLILGENGTGKELVARALHRQSTRHGEVFLSVDMGAVAESLFESELFGLYQRRVYECQRAPGRTLRTGIRRYAVSRRNRQPVAADASQAAASVGNTTGNAAGRE